MSTLWVTNTRNSGPGSLRAAIVKANTKADFDTIKFAPGFAGTIQLRSELRITSSLAIDGPGSDLLTLSGGGKGRVIHIVGDRGCLPVIDVRIAGLTVTEGSDRIGAGILNAGANVSLTDAVITANNATSAAEAKLTMGGGIANIGPNATLTLADCVISANTADLGGGLYAGAGTTVSIVGGSVAINQAADAGGILNAGTLTMEDGSVSGNVAAGVLLLDPASDTAHGGGGIRNRPGGLLVLTRMGFEANVAYAAPGCDVFGGGLLNEGAAIVDTSQFTANQAVGGAGSAFFYGSCGGAIDNFGTARLDVTSSVFQGNQAIGADGAYGIGGAIENNAGFNGYDTTFGSQAAIRGSQFLDNLGTGGIGGYGNGGAIDNEGSGAVMTLDDCLIQGNRSVGGPGADGITTLGQGIGGGVMNALYGQLTITRCTIDSNLALGGDQSTPTPENPLTGAGNGGGVVNAGWADMTLRDTIITSNTASGGQTTVGPGATALGGGIDNFLYATTTLIGCTLSGNAAYAGSGGATPGNAPSVGQAWGGAIDLFRNCSLTLEGCTIDGNEAVGGSGEGAVAGGNALGGAIAVGTNALIGYTDNSSLVARDTLFTGNLARGGDGGPEACGGWTYGGGLYFAPSNDPQVTPTSSLERCQILANSAVGTDRISLGGGLAVDGCSLTVADCLIARNSAGDGGGCVAFRSDVSLSATEISENVADHGGGMSATACTLAITSASSVHDNVSFNDGGGLSLSETNLTFANSTLYRNRSYANGGGLAMSGGALTIDGSVVGGNAAQFNGGGVMVSDGCVVAIRNASIIQANVAASGGGVFASDSSVTIDGASVVSQNRASSFTGGRGGGLYVRNTDLRIDGQSSVEGNSAHYVGGGIGAEGSRVTITGASTILGNTVDEGDGGGGGIIVWGGLLTIEAVSRISANQAPFGGGVFVQSLHGGDVPEQPRVTIRDSLIDFNGAYHRGGGLYVLSGDVTIDDSWIITNWAFDGCRNVSGPVRVQRTTVGSTQYGNGYWLINCG